MLTVSTFLCACVNITVVEKDDGSKKQEKEEASLPTIAGEKLYTSSSNIYISQGSSGDVSSDQLNSTKSLAATFNVILQDRTIQAPIKKAYPDVEYNCELKFVNETGIFTIIVNSNERESLKEICEMITNEFCSQIPTIVGNISVKIVKTASEPQKV